MSSLDRIHYKKRMRKPPNLKKLQSQERAHKRNFLVFEIGFIIVVVPLLITGFATIPFSMYYAIVKDFRMWPLVFVGTTIAFVQILATKFFIKKFFLDPYNMTLGEYLRMRYDERNKSENKQDDSKIKVWYDNLDEFIFRIKTEQKEQTEKLYTQHYEKINN